MYKRKCLQQLKFWNHCVFGLVFFILQCAIANSLNETHDETLMPNFLHLFLAMKTCQIKYTKNGDRAKC